MVFYDHFGTRSPPEDRVPLQIRYDSPTETLIIPFTLRINVVFDPQLDIVAKNMPIVVNEIGGFSAPIDDTVVNFNYDQNEETCVVSMLSVGGRPRYGHIDAPFDQLFMVACDAFISNDLKYKHTTTPTSPNRDYIPMVVEVADKDGNVRREYFQIVVDIVQGTVNIPPSKNVNAVLLMAVDQFVMTAVTPDILSAEDQETPADKIVFNITKPLQYGEGVIVSTDDRSLPLTSFYQKDVLDLKIAYKPPSSDADIQRIYQVELKAVDNDGLASDPFILTIIVKPMNTLAPVVTRNTGLQLFEGESRPFSSTQNLEIADEDNLEDVRISILYGGSHGDLLVMGLQRKFFTPADLDAGVVSYQHDGSDTYSDNIIFRMTDGENVVEFLFPITISPEDDEPPLVNVNTGLQVQRGNLRDISPLVLSATDVDSDDEAIQFRLVQPFSKEGAIVFRVDENPNSALAWHLIDGKWELPVMKWTQKDIVDGIVFYRHVGQQRSDVFMDRIRFRVADNNVPPNQSSDQEFVVKVMPVDDQPPFLVLTSQLRMTVDEFQMTPLSHAVLQYTDDDTIDRELKYTITKGPFDSDTSSPLGAGKLVLTDDPNTEVTMFTQAEVAHLKISYLPPDVELGVTQRAIQFIFDVEDTNGNVAPDQVFTIFLKPINDKPPIVKNTGTVVLENGFLFITTDMLDASDEDSNIDSIIFTIVSGPTNGVLQLGPDELKPGDAFTRKDVVDGQVVYKNIGFEMDSDKVDLDVTDGVHHIPIEFKIKIHSIDDEAPTLDMPDGTVGAYLEVDEGKSDVISSDILKADDPDTDPMKLTFIVDTPPGKGVITRDGVPVNSFTQEELIAGRIAYQHTGGEIGLQQKSDIFNLTISDMSNEWVIGGNSIQTVDVFVTIDPVDNTPPIVTVGSGGGQPGGQGGLDGFTVEEAGRATLAQKFIDVTDVDTPMEDLICTIVVQPELGYIETTAPAPGSEKSRMGMWVSSFTMVDILNRKINYHQSIHQGIEPIEDRFTFQCTDGVNLSPNFIFPIRISPTNDETPEIAAREFIVMEGMNLMIDTPILNADDKDVPADYLLFEIIERPKHGDIIRQTPSGGQQVETFTLEDITSSSNIVYEHDDSETTRDSFKVRVTDGKFSSEKTIMIIVIPVDDETPRLMINNGLQVKRDEAKVITNADLKATDLDTDDSTLKFLVRREPRFGVLQMVIGNVVKNLTRGQNFTQFDIDTGRIRYLDKGKGGYRDLIKFDITDGTNPLIDRYFFISLEGLDLIYPEVLNQGVELPEGGSVTLTTDIMSTSDLNTPDENLRFTLTKPPSRGHLESSDNPGVPITTFTQLELAGNKIKYVHTSDDEVKMDNFEFEVSDGFNSVFQTFRISLSSVDNKKPVLMFEPLKVKEGGSRLITPFELKAVDQDTPEENVVFQITKSPTKGQLKLEGQDGPVVSFSMLDLHENRLSYVHDGSESTADFFTFLLTDGTHNDFYVYPNTVFTTSAPQTMRIQIISIDNGMPTIEANNGAENLALDDDGLYGVVINDKFLKVTDRDTLSRDLKYKVTKPPKNGYIVVLGEQNGSQLNWTQGRTYFLYFNFSSLLNPLYLEFSYMYLCSF
jgi:hypothetical protein